MTISEYAPQYEDQVKDLLLELQIYLSALDVRGVLTVKDNYRDEYFRYIRNDAAVHHGKIFVAEKHGRAVGVVVCKIFQGGGESELTTTCPKIGFISDLAVTESERGCGIGKKLIAQAERFFADRRCEYTQLEVFAPNARAAELYKRLGFVTLCTYMSKKTEAK